MKIALVLDRFDSSIGGLEKWAFQWALWLLKMRHEVHVVAFDFGALAQTMNVITHRIKKVHNRLKRAAAFEKVLSKLKVDIIHDLGVGWYFDVLHPKAGSKVVNYQRHLVSLPSWKRNIRRISPFDRRRYQQMQALERRQYSGSDGTVIAVSRMVQTHLQAHYNVDPGRIKLVYNGVDLSRFQGERRAHRERIRKELGLQREVLFLQSTNNYRLKGVDTALEALRYLTGKNVHVHLAVIGRGPVDSYRKRASHLKVAKSVTFCGSAEDPVPYFMAADVYLHPAYYDACSSSVLEAWAAGLPVITSRFVGADELMTHGVEGFIVDDPGNAHELAEKMKLLLNQSLRSQMAASAKLLGPALDIEKRFSEIEHIFLSSVLSSRCHGRR